MGKIACADKVESLDFCVLRNFGYIHLFAGRAAVFTVDMEISYGSQIGSPIGNVLAAGFKPLLNPELKTANGLA